MDEQSDESREAADSDNEAASDQEDAVSEVCRSDQNPESPVASDIGSPSSPDRNEPDRPEHDDSEAEVQQSEPEEEAEDVQSEQAEHSEREESEEEVERMTTDTQQLESEEEAARKSESEEEIENEPQSDHEEDVKNGANDQEDEAPASPNTPASPATPASPVSPTSPTSPASPASPAQTSDDEVEREEPEVRDSQDILDKGEDIPSDVDDKHSEEEDRHSVADSRQSDAEERQSDGDDRQSVSSEREVQRDDDDEEVHRSPATPDSDVEAEPDLKADSDADVRSPSPLLAPKKKGRLFDSDQSDSEDEKDESEDESKVGELIADIFGESDEDEEFEGFGEQDVEAAKKKKLTNKKKVISDSEDEDNKEVKEQPEEEDETLKISDDEKEVEEPEEKVEEVEEPAVPTEETPKENVAKADSSDDEGVEDKNRRLPEDFVSDFDLMLQRKKDGQRKRKAKNVDIISDSDDLIAEIISQMKQAADEDRTLNKNKMAATKKMKMLPMVLSQLRKHDLKIVFLDQGVLSVMTDWLMPLPDRALPHLHIRDAMLRLLAEFPPIDQSLLKSSGIGRAVMYLYKHPKETKENRERAGRLISEWSRPIFNLNANYTSISKEEREHRDFEHMPKKRKLRLSTGDESVENKDIDRALSGEEKALRPGEKGWISRARVPMPSTRDYVVRPKWNTETEFRSRNSSKKQQSRLEKQVRTLRDKKKMNRMQRAVSISIEGRKMAL